MPTKPTTKPAPVKRTAKTAPTPPSRKPRKPAAPAKLDPRLTHPLAHLIPSMDVYEGYSARNVLGDIGDLAWLETGWAGIEQPGGAMRRPNILVEGPTGAAKSTVIRAFAALHGIPLLTISGYAGVDLDVLIGGPGIAPDGTPRMFVPGDLTLALIYSGCIVEIDEINYIPPKQLGRLNSLLDGRRRLTIPEASGTGFCCSCSLMNDPMRIEREREQWTLFHLGKRRTQPTPIVCSHCAEPFNDSVVVAKEDVMVYATQNPGYEGTYPLNEALRNRFNWIVEWGYNNKCELDLLWSPALLEFATDIRSRYGTDFATPLGTNRLIEFETIALGDLGVGAATEMLLYSFATEEREAVRKVLEQHMPRIVAELEGGGTEDDDDND